MARKSDLELQGNRDVAHRHHVILRDGILESDNCSKRRLCKSKLRLDLYY